MATYYAVVLKDRDDFCFCNLSPLDGGEYNEDFQITSSMVHAASMAEGLKRLHPAFTYTIVSFNLPEEIQ